MPTLILVLTDIYFDSHILKALSLKALQCFVVLTLTRLMFVFSTVFGKGIFYLNYQ